MHRHSTCRTLLGMIGALSIALILPACSSCGEEPGGGSGNDAAIRDVANPDADVDPPDSGRDAGNDSGADSGAMDGAVDGGAADGGDAGANPNNPNNAMIDTDCDGLSDAEEFSIIYPSGMRTNPNNPDTDGDGILDGIEAGRISAVAGSGCAPIADADPTTTTSPVRADTDGDGIPDGVEDLNRNGAREADESSPRLTDTDNDGLPDNVEDANRNGVRDPGETHPNRRDTDGDVVADGIEDRDRNGVVNMTEWDPRVADTDADGLRDGEEDTNHNGLRELYETDPLEPDTDCDGLSDFDELRVYGTSPLSPDTDGDGVYDGVELGVVSAVTGTRCLNVPVDVDPSTTTDPLDMDTDGDGLVDGEEDVNGNGAVDVGETNPGNADTDGDGVSDGDEVLAGFDPLNPLDPPMGQTPGINAICSTNNLRVVDFDVGAATWTIANEVAMAYAPITVGAAGVGVSVGALDEPTQGVAGFVLRMPLVAGQATLMAQAQGVEGRISGGVAAEGLAYALRLSGRSINSHDGFQTLVSNVVDINVSAGTRNAALIRNSLLRLITTLPGTEFTGLPGNTGGATNQFTVSYQVLLRTNPSQLVVVGAVMPRAAFDDVTNNAAFLMQDLTNGTALAVAEARRGKACNPFVAQGQSVADFIWMADISGSTDDDRLNISNAAQAIYGALAQNGVDFRMGVVPHTENAARLGAGNAGNLRGAGFVRDPNLFTSYLLDAGGADGCEFGLMASRDAISRALPRTAPGAAENARRLRADATLAVVYISDEYAQEITMTTGANSQVCFAYTPGCDTGVRDYYAASNNLVCQAAQNATQQSCVNSIVQPYIDQINANNGIAFAQVIVPNANPSICTAYACPAQPPPAPPPQAANEPGLGYTHVVNGTGGAFYTPCSANPGAALQAIVDAVAGAASQYQLSGPPISSTIRVGVVRLGTGGTGAVELVPRDRVNGFDYDAASNSIFFRGFTYRPNQNDVVVISYRNWRPPQDPCPPCAANQVCDPQLGVCTCDAAVCAACGQNETCDANCDCACAADCNGNCGAGETCNQATCQCECTPDCGGACTDGTVCNQATCQCECSTDCNGACAGTLTECNTAACNCQCPANCGGACTGNTICNSSLCECSCDPNCDGACPGSSVCDPTQDCACVCPTDCGGCQDNTVCNQTSCQCECPANCEQANGCINRQVCDPTNSCQCICPTDCGGCQANETCDQANCRCIPVV